MSGVGRRSQTTRSSELSGRKDPHRVEKNSKMPAQIPAKNALLAYSNKVAHAPTAGDSKLRVSLDFGTATMASAVVLAQPGIEYTAADVRTVHFSSKAHYAPQLVAWDQAGNFYWGHEVAKAVKRGLVEPENVIGLFKLLLDKDHSTSNMAKRIREQLGTHTLDDLLETLIREVLKAVREWCKSQVLIVDAVKSPEALDALQIELFLSVPQNWEAPANRKLSTAAIRGGAANVFLVLEPQCAAAYFTSVMMTRTSQVLKEDDVLLVADIGGGTGDFVSLKYEDTLSAGAKVRLDTVREPEGKMCGSQFVNENCLDYVHALAERDYGGFEARCNRLVITVANGNWQLDQEFNRIKEDFEGPGDTVPSEYITIVGEAQDSKGQRRKWMIEFNSTTMASFFDPVIDEIMGCINRQMTDDTKVCTNTYCPLAKC